MGSVFTKNGQEQSVFVSQVTLPKVKKTFFEREHDWVGCLCLLSAVPIESLWEGAAASFLIFIIYFWQLWQPITMYDRISFCRKFNATSFVWPNENWGQRRHSLVKTKMHRQIRLRCLFPDQDDEIKAITRRLQ